MNKIYEKITKDNADSISCGDKHLLRTDQTRKRGRPYEFEKILNVVRYSIQNNICGAGRVSVVPDRYREHLWNSA